jgi:RNA recognition motif-containing protein
LKKLYVGNLPFETNEDELREMFEQHGPTVSVRVITDRETGRSRGFGFVEFESDSNAQAALQALDGRDMGGRALRVNEAQDKERRGGGGRR